MKKTLLVVSTLLFSAILVNEDATGLLNRFRDRATRTFKKKDDDGKILKSIVDILDKAKKLIKAFVELLDKTRDIKLRNGEPVQILSAYKEQADTAEAMLDILYDVTSALLTAYINLTQAEKTLESSQSTKKTSQAEDNSRTAKVAIINGLETLVGSGVESQIANTNSSIIIAIEMLEKLEPESVDKQWKEQAKKINKILSELDSVINQLPSVCERIGEAAERELTSEELDAMEEVVNVVVRLKEFMQVASDVLENGKRPTTERKLKEISEECSSKAQGSPEDEAERKVTKKQKDIDLYDDEEFEEESSVKKNRKAVKRSRSDDEEFEEEPPAKQSRRATKRSRMDDEDEEEELEPKRRR